MKKVIVMMVMVFLLIPSVVCRAADGNVTYSGNAGRFIFAPGSDHSPTDLFPDFKGVMPGDRLTQRIIITNLADDTVETEIFLRSYGADGASEEFLSQLRLYVRTAGGDIIDDTAEKPFGLDKPVSLGRFRAYDTAELELILEVPEELDNKYASQVGKIRWEFSLIEMQNSQQSDEQSVDVSKESSDESLVPSQSDTISTGDGTPYAVYIIISAAALSVIALLWRKHSDRKT